MGINVNCQYANSHNTRILYCDKKPKFLGIFRQGCSAFYGGCNEQVMVPRPSSPPPGQQSATLNNGEIK